MYVKVTTGRAAFLTWSCPRMDRRAPKVKECTGKGA